MQLRERVAERRRFAGGRLRHDVCGLRARRIGDECGVGRDGLRQREGLLAAAGEGGRGWAARAGGGGQLGVGHGRLGGAGRQRARHGLQHELVHGARIAEAHLGLGRVHVDVDAARVELEEQQ